MTSILDSLFTNHTINSGDVIETRKKISFRIFIKIFVLVFPNDEKSRKILTYIFRSMSKSKKDNVNETDYENYKSCDFVSNFLIMKFFLLWIMNAYITHHSLHLK